MNKHTEPLKTLGYSGDRFLICENAGREGHYHYTIHSETNAQSWADLHPGDIVVDLQEA